MFAQAFEHPVGHDSARREDVDFDGGLEEFGLRVLDDDPPHLGQQEHGAVIAGVTGDEDFVETDLQLLAEPAQRAAFGRVFRQDIEVNLTGVNDVGVDPGVPEGIADRVDLGGLSLVEIPARFMGVLKMLRLIGEVEVRHHFLHPIPIPALKQALVELLERSPGVGVDDLRAHPADIVIGLRQRALFDEGLHVGHESAAVEDEQRTLAVGLGLPRRDETLGGLRIAEQSAIQIGAEEADRFGRGSGFSHGACVAWHEPAEVRVSGKKYRAGKARRSQRQQSGRPVQGQGGPGFG